MTAFSFRKWSLKRKLPATTAAFIVTTVLFILVILKYSSKRSSVNRCTEKEAEMRRTIGTELVDKFYDYNTCIYVRIFAASPNEFWSLLWPTMNDCLKDMKLSDASLEAFRNNDKIKYHILPNDGTKSDDCVIITAGIGHDIRAEIAIRKRLRDVQWKCKFHGADPITTKNEDLYKSIGTFYNFAVGNRTAKAWTSVKENVASETYTKRTFPHVEMVQFFKEYIKSPKIIDQYLLDVEYAEYGMTHYFLEGSPLDDEEIDICQMNIEFHEENKIVDRSLFFNFVRRALREHRWVFFKPDIDEHARLFMLNVQSPACAERYIVDKF
ncbi:hypothetical protein L596_029764 [Steinernema carpocapsae]|uniref:Uncharacterized protein n=1 Tax=Steinernema carpocapsae TaxID=34508 RepID=A0A4U5LQR6_STECR|nr:hypothetical protein L596_029764 [Steinernema carpocapsae]